MEQTHDKPENAAAKADGSESPMKPIARLRLLYESKDRRMCLFEDAEGHLVSVPSSRLA